VRSNDTPACSNCRRGGRSCPPIAAIAPAVGGRGDAYDNALAESVIGLFKMEVICRRGPCRHVGAVEFVTLG
jgi:hypothetical protein